MPTEEEIKESITALGTALSDDAKKIFALDEDAFQQYLDNEINDGREDDPLFQTLEKNMEIINGAATHIHDWLEEEKTRGKQIGEFIGAGLETGAFITKIVKGPGTAALIVSSVILVHLSIRIVRLLGKWMGLSTLVQKMTPGWLKRGAKKGFKVFKKIHEHVTDALGGENNVELIENCLIATAGFVFASNWVFAGITGLALFIDVLVYVLVRKEKISVTSISLGHGNGDPSLNVQLKLMDL